MKKDLTKVLVLFFTLLMTTVILGADTTPPTVSITNLANGNYVGGLYTITATATDNVKVSKVVFYKNTTVVATITAAPYKAEYNFNTDAANTSLTIKAIAYDSSNNKKEVSFTVYKPNHNLSRIGATIVNNGAFFKIFHPAAKEIQVTGAFYGWALTKNYFWRDGNYWWTFVPNAKDGDGYNFVIDGVQTIDPAASKVKDDFWNQTIGQNGNMGYLSTSNFGWKYDSYFATERKTFERYNIYELHWGTFRRTNGTTTYEKFVTGTTENDKRFSANQKLQYIKNLNFTAVALMPIHEANGNTNAGYDPSFYFATENAYGSIADFRILVDEAHKLGLSVIVDVVYNHLTSIEGNASFCQPALKPYYLRYNAPWSEEVQWGKDWGPNPDSERAEIQSFFTDCSRMYIRECHVDGIRFDATKVYPGAGLQTIIGQLSTEFPDKYLISEHLGEEGFPWLINTVKFDAAWHDVGYKNMQNALNSGDAASRVDSFKKAVGFNQGGYPNTAIKYFTGSHDEVWTEHDGKWLVSKLGGRDNWYARAKTRLAYAAGLYAMGTPMMFMGTEGIADYNGWHSYYGVHWEQVDDNNYGAKMKTMVTHSNSFRESCGAFRTSNISWVHTDNTNGIVAYKRWDNAGNVVLVIANLGDNDFLSRTYLINTGDTGQWTQAFSSQNYRYSDWVGCDNEGYEPWADGNGKIAINLPKWSLIVMKKK